MSEFTKSEEKPSADWSWDIKNLKSRMDRIEHDFQGQIDALSKRVRLLVRILVDKKIVGEEIAKSVEESVAEDEEDEDKLIEWFLSEREKNKE